MQEDQKIRENTMLLVRAFVDDGMMLNIEAQHLNAISKEYGKRADEEAAKLVEGTSLPILTIHKWSEQAMRYSALAAELQHLALERTKEAAGLLRSIGIDIEDPSEEDLENMIDLVNKVIG